MFLERLAGGPPAQKGDDVRVVFLWDNLGKHVYTHADLDSMQSLSERVRDGKSAGLRAKRMHRNDVVALHSRSVALSSLRAWLSWELFPPCLSQDCISAMLSVWTSRRLLKMSNLPA